VSLSPTTRCGPWPVLIRHRREHLEEFFNVSREQLQSIYERMEGDRAGGDERPHGR
jgi:hypothetical protein